MHGTGKGKEGTNIKGRQGRTPFDCPKSKKKVENKKFAARFSPNWWGSGKNGGHRRVQWSEADTAVCSKLKNKFFFETEYTGTAQETEYINRSRIIIIFIA